MRHAVPAALAAALLLSPLAAAAQTTGAATATPGAASATPLTALSAGQFRVKDLMDRDVYSSDNVEIGEVEDLVLDPGTGRIVAVVIEYEGRLGFTEKHVAVPLDRLRFGENRRVTVAMTRDELRAMPGFNYRD